MSEKEDEELRELEHSDPESSDQSDNMVRFKHGELLAHLKVFLGHERY